MIWEDGIPGMKPGEERTLTEGGHTFRITATDRLGCDTGRRRYAVVCVTCNEVVHEATTGPCQMVGRHVREAADGDPE